MKHVTFDLHCLSITTKLSPYSMSAIHIILKYIATNISIIFIQITVIENEVFELLNAICMNIDIKFAKVTNTEIVMNIIFIGLEGIILEQDLYHGGLAGHFTPDVTMQQSL